ncbi:MAG: RHS repeat-associated core domain-containing protein [Phycisphaerales bacterium]|nr:hypothetical protein [Phycisphaerales bacterium]
MAVCAQVTSQLAAKTWPTADPKPQWHEPSKTAPPTLSASIAGDKKVSDITGMNSTYIPAQGTGGESPMHGIYNPAGLPFPIELWPGDPSIRPDIGFFNPSTMSEPCLGINCGQQPNVSPFPPTDAPSQCDSPFGGSNLMCDSHPPGGHSPLPGWEPRIFKVDPLDNGTDSPQGEPTVPGPPNWDGKKTVYQDELDEYMRVSGYPLLPVPGNLCLDKDCRCFTPRDQPVNLRTGYKIEDATDLAVMLPSRPLVWRRAYSSDNALVSTNSVGSNWTVANHFSRIRIDNTNDTFAIIDGRNAIVLGETGTGTNIYLGPKGSGLKAVQESAIRLDPDNNDIDGWKVTNGGAWTRYYTDTTSTAPGVLLREEDAYGNRLEYYYAWDGVPGVTNKVLLTRIVASSVDPDPAVSTQRTDAMLHIAWSAVNGSYKVAEVSALRALRDSGTWKWGLLHQSNYTYHDGTTHHDDAGVVGDLLQVETIEPTFSDGVTMFAFDSSSLSDPLNTLSQPREVRQQYEQYRYYGGNSGDFIQALKAVIYPAQLEYAQWKHSVDPSNLLEQADSYSLDTGGPVLLDLASKVVTYFNASGQPYHKRVETQEIRRGCSCVIDSGRSQKLTYKYVSSPTSPASDVVRSVKVTSTVWDGSAWADHLTYWYDFVEFPLGDDEGGDPTLMTGLLKHVAVIEDVSPNRSWVTRFLYNEDGRLETIADPSSAQGYSRTSDTAVPAISDVTSGGRKLHYEYYESGSEAGSMKLTRISDAQESTSSQSIVARYHYFKPSTTNLTELGPSQYVRKVEYVRDEGVGTETELDSLISSDPDAVEVVRYEVVFHRETSFGYQGLAGIAMFTEAELPEENGPSDSGGAVEYVQHRLFDRCGRLIWTRDADGALVRFDYDSDDTTGQPTRVVAHSTPPYVNSSTDPEYWPTSGSGHSFQLGDSGTGDPTADWDGKPVSTSSHGEILMTAMTHDPIGRLTSYRDPIGVVINQRFEMRTDPAHEDSTSSIEWLAKITVPAGVSVSSTGGGQTNYDGFTGPLVVEYKNANGQTIGIRAFELTSAARDVDGNLVTPAGGSSLYTVGNTVARGFQDLDLAGAATKYCTYFDVSAGSSGRYETTLEYDALGMIVSKTDPGGTVWEVTRDSLSRPLALSVGTSTSNQKTLVEYFYDSGGAASQGAGAGLITLMRVHTGDSTTRDTKYHYDHRHRRVCIENPATPHVYLKYDNFGRVIERAAFTSTSAPTAIDTPLADRFLHMKNHFSQRGKLYHKESAVDASSSSTDYTDEYYWYDSDGRSIAYWMRGSTASKVFFDELGRPVTSYMTDRGGDAAPLSASNYADALSVTGDTVLEQTDIRYIENWPVADLVTERSLVHNPDRTGSFTGDLSGVDVEHVITQYSGQYYDTAGRPIREVFFGTGKSEFAYLTSTEAANPPTVDQSSPPSAGPASDKIVTAVSYDEIGRVEFETDANGTQSKTVYDDLGRVVAVIEGYEDATVTKASPYWTASLGSNPTSTDKDLVTLFGYNGDSETTYVVSVSHDGTSVEYRETVFEYGVTAGAGNEASEVNAYTLVNAMLLPDPGTGEAGGSGGTDPDLRIEFAYNRIGETKFVKDRAGRKHKYTLDARGMVTSDEILDFAGADSTVAQLAYGYDSAGRLSTVRSLDSSSNVLNAIKYQYTSTSQIDLVKIAHAGDVDTTGVPQEIIDYTYADPATKGIPRLTSVEYPTTTVLDFEYVFDGGTGSREQVDNDLISRVNKLSWDGPGSGSYDHEIEYQFLGSSMLASRAYNMPYRSAGVEQTIYADSLASSPTTGEYPALDRFGRLERYRWIDVGLDPTSKPAIVDDHLAFESTHNMFLERYKRDRRGGTSSIISASKRPDRDYEYSYDEFDQLAERRVGQHDGTDLDVPSGAFGSQRWTLDHLGNWASVETDVDGTPSSGAPQYGDNAADIDDERTHDLANRMIGRFGQSTGSLTFDENGNTLSMKRGTIPVTFVYDAWDRLVEVKIRNLSRAKYSYFADHSTAIRQADTDFDGTMDYRHRYFNSAGWRLLEERIDEDVSGTWTHVETLQNIWGLTRQDDLAYFQRDDDIDGTFDEGFYIIDNANGDIVAVFSTEAGLRESVDYASYGEGRVARKGDVNRDGVVDIADYNLFSTASGKTLGNSDYDVDVDFDRDGDCDVDDFNVILNAWGLTTDPLDITTDSVGNTHGFAGYHHDSAIQMYLVRYRVYEPELGRWLTEDPIGLLGGPNSYAYVNAQPHAANDPFGLTPDWGDGPGGGFYPMPPMPVAPKIDPRDIMVGTSDPTNAWDRYWQETNDEWRPMKYTIDECGFLVPAGRGFNWGRAAITAAAFVIDRFTAGIGGKLFKRGIGLFRRACKLNSFVAGTLVLTTGGAVPIEEISIGTSVYSASQEILPGNEIAFPDVWDRSRVVPVGYDSKADRPIPLQIDASDISIYDPAAWRVPDTDDFVVLIDESMCVVGETPAWALESGEQFVFQGKVWRSELSSTGMMALIDTGLVTGMVSDVFAHSTKQTVTVTFEDENGREWSVTGTPEHPVYDTASDSWIPLEHLGQGDAAPVAVIGQSRVVSATLVDAETVVYNLTIAMSEAYFVHGVLVHNSVCSNRARGLLAQEQVADLLRSNPAVKSVTSGRSIPTPFGRRVPDLEVEMKDGSLHHVEVKTGGSLYGPAQRAKDSWIRRHLKIPTVVVRPY